MNPVIPKSETVVPLTRKNQKQMNIYKQTPSSNAIYLQTDFHTDEISPLFKSGYNSNFDEHNVEGLDIFLLTVTKKE